jgi:hypothetical protein
MFMKLRACNVQKAKKKGRRGNMVPENDMQQLTANKAKGIFLEWPNTMFMVEST